MRYKTDLRPFLLLLAAAFAGGCASTQNQSCELSPAETQQLQTSALAFLADKRPGADMSCEEITATVQPLRGRGCAIYGMPKSGATCPASFDGDYWIVFDRATLQPTQLLLIAR